VWPRSKEADLTLERTVLRVAFAVIVASQLVALHAFVRILRVLRHSRSEIAA